MPAKVWIGRQALNYSLGLLASCQCQHPLPPDAGIDGGEIVDAAVEDAPTHVDAGIDAGPSCSIVAGSWRFRGTGAPIACGMFEFVADLGSLADARGSRECTTGCSCASTVPVEPDCTMQWSETCGSTFVQCDFHRMDDGWILGHCDDGACAVAWSAMPL